MASKMWVVSTPRPKSDGGTWWHRLGTAWTNEKGLTTIYLDSYPIPDEKGAVKMMLFEPTPQDQRPVPRPAPQTQEWRKELDDEIPF